MRNMGLPEDGGEESFIPDGWICNYCDHHNDDLYDDVCEDCGRNRTRVY